MSEISVAQDSSEHKAERGVLRVVCRFRGAEESHGRVPPGLCAVPVDRLCSPRGTPPAQAALPAGARQGTWPCGQRLQGCKGLNPHTLGGPALEPVEQLRGQVQVLQDGAGATGGHDGGSHDACATSTTDGTPR